MHVNLGDTEHIAKKLADKYHGGNVSACIQQLIKDKYQQVTTTQHQQVQKTSLVLYQTLFYSILTTTVVMIGLSALYTIFVVILPIFLFIFGVIALLFMVMTLKTKRILREVNM